MLWLNKEMKQKNNKNEYNIIEIIVFYCSYIYIINNQILKYLVDSR